MKYRYAIEMGGANTKIYVKDCGLALCEPTLVSATPSAQGYKVLGLGADAKKLMGKTNENVEVFSPVSNGVIENYEYCQRLLEHLFKKVGYKKRENVMVLVNCALTEEQKRQYQNLLHSIGFKEVALVPSVICSCVGAGKNITSTKASMVVNLGGANTDIAVVNMSSIIKGATLGLGGRAMDSGISHAVAYNQGLVIGLAAAETLKNEVGSLFTNDTLNMEVTGVDVETKIPRGHIITARDLYPVLAPYFDEIIRSIEVTITSLPPEVSTDILSSGVMLCGGVANIAGLGDYFKRHFRFPFYIVEDCENVAILGAGKLLDDEKLIAKITENFN